MKSVAYEDLIDQIARNIFVDPMPKDNRDNCLFYHSIDLPGGESIIGEWDMRGKFDQYIGHVDLKSKTVLDIGTASGFLSFESEKRGASVVSFDAKDTSLYTRLPHATGRHVDDPIKALAEDNSWLEAVKRSYWYAHHTLELKIKVHYGNLYDIPFFKNVFDVTIVGQFLVHNRSGIDVLMAAAATTHDYLIITEGTFDSPTPAASFIGRADHPNDYFSNWLYSSSFYREIGQMLGFKLESFKVEPFLCNAANHQNIIDLGVFVFRRR